jgi:transposase
VVGNKNDHNDAIAIAEASRRSKASFLPMNSLEQQDLPSLQRIRELLIKHRTAIGNQLRGLLAEYGVVIPKGLRYLRAHPCKAIVAIIPKSFRLRLALQIIRGCLYHLIQNIICPIKIARKIPTKIPDIQPLFIKMTLSDF